jgi:hypothetical protein
MSLEVNNESLTGPILSRAIFGGVLDYDGAGLYPGLELLNLVFDVQSEQFLPTGGSVNIKRKSHDFARRLVWDDGFTDAQEKHEVLYDIQTEEAVRHLLSSLQLPIPSTSKSPGWDRAHFFPFTKSLIHWDARKRGGRIRIERRYLRGGGALAYNVLRHDSDSARLKRVRQGFADLYSDNEASALEKLAETLLGRGHIDTEAVEDKLEFESAIKRDDNEDLLRDGVANILGHEKLSAVARIKALMSWVAFWLILIQHSRASEFLETPTSALICDCNASHVQLRRASQRCLKDMESLILGAVEKAANGEEVKSKQRNKLRGFFWASAATIKLLNAWRGRRHFILGLELAETLVLAGIDGTSEMPFEQFVDQWLYDKCRLVIGRSAAQKHGLLESFDASVFEDNENSLAEQMRAAGLLTEYSDTTRMVGTGGLL